MSDELLPYYRRELTFIRKMAGEFARAHPGFAERLRVSGEESKDPHVERLIQAFAYLTARIRLKLDDEFPELSDAMLGMLYPHYLAPIPSMSVVEFAMQRKQTDLPAGYAVKAGTPVQAEATGGDMVRYRTNYPVTLMPVEVTGATLGGLSFSAATSRDRKVAAVLKLNLSTFAPDLPFSAMRFPNLPAGDMPEGPSVMADGVSPETVAGAPESLPGMRFFLHGEPQHILHLYELLMNNLADVTLTPGDAHLGKPGPVVSLGPHCVRPVGFARSEAILPYGPRSLDGYRILSEYFVFRDKYLFIDLLGLTPMRLAAVGQTLTVSFFLSRSDTDLEHNVTASTFRLGCTPVVNLFTMRAEPIKLTGAEVDYRVVPDARKPQANEVYSVDRASAVGSDGREVEFLPFYSLKHSGTAGERGAFYNLSRKPSPPAEGRADRGTDVSIVPVDLNFQRLARSDLTMIVETTCLNRDLPGRLPFGGGQPALQLPEGGPIVARCLTQPTPTRRPANGARAAWKLVSHLSLNHLSIGGREGGDGAPDPSAADALREILSLYDFTNSSDARARIEAVRSVACKRVVGRAGSTLAGGIARGLEITIMLDERAFSDHGLYLFASVLERFLALYGSINSFTRCVVRSEQREGDLRRWKPRAGERAIL